MNLPAKFIGEESPTALLSNATVSHDRFGVLETSVSQMVDKITEIRDGKF